MWKKFLILSLVLWFINFSLFFYEKIMKYENQITPEEILFSDLSY